MRAYQSCSSMDRSDLTSSDVSSSHPRHRLLSSSSFRVEGACPSRDSGKNSRLQVSLLQWIPPGVKKPVSSTIVPTTRGSTEWIRSVSQALQVTADLFVYNVTPQLHCKMLAGIP